MAYFCYKCGRELSDENSCCGYCGTFHGWSSSKKNKAVTNCPKCGRKLESGTSICSYCFTWHGKW